MHKRLAGSGHSHQRCLQEWRRPGCSATAETPGPAVAAGCPWPGGPSQTGPRSGQPPPLQRLPAQHDHHDFNDESACFPQLQTCREPAASMCLCETASLKCSMALEGAVCDAGCVHALCKHAISFSVPSASACHQLQHPCRPACSGMLLMKAARTAAGWLMPTPAGSPEREWPCTSAPLLGSEGFPGSPAWPATVPCGTSHRLTACQHACREAQHAVKHLAASMNTVVSRPSGDAEHALRQTHMYNAGSACVLVALMRSQGASGQSAPAGALRAACARSGLR